MNHEVKYSDGFSCVCDLIKTFGLTLYKKHTEFIGQVQILL